MIERIQIRDFQSIESLDIECGPITVIHGESDTGKSAVVRALYGLAYNTYPKGHVREGAQDSEVGVTIDGVTVRARKGASNQYEMDDVGTEMLGWDKVGTEVPPAVQEVLGWPVLELDDGSKFTPSFGLQFDAPFLLTDSPSKRAKLLGTLTNVATLYAAVKEANAWERRAKLRGDTAQEIIDTTGEQIDPITAMIEHEQTKVNELMAVLATAQEKKMAVSRFEQLHLKMVEMGETVALAQAIIEMMDEADPSAELKKADRLLTKAEGLSALSGNIETAQREIVGLEQLMMNLEKTEIEKVKAVAAFEKEHSLCPLCGNLWEHHDEH